MSLEADLARIRRASAAAMAPDDRRAIRQTIDQADMLQLAGQSLQVGEILPDFALPDPTGRMVTSGELLDRGPIVLAFFRGRWCPYCRTALHALEAAFPAIVAAGATLVGVARETPEQLQLTARDCGLGFLLLSDCEGVLSGLCGIGFEVPAEHVAFLRRASIDLTGGREDASWWLPLPATYVVRRDGVIVHAFIDPDWSYRAEPDELVSAVRALDQSTPAVSSR